MTTDPTADDLRCSCPMGLNVPRDPECAVHRRVGDDVEAWELREAQRVAEACGLSLQPPPQPGTVTVDMLPGEVGCKAPSHEHCIATKEDLEVAAEVVEAQGGKPLATALRNLAAALADADRLQAALDRGYRLHPAPQPGTVTVNADDLEAFVNAWPGWMDARERLAAALADADR